MLRRRNACYDGQVIWVGKARDDAIRVTKSRLFAKRCQKRGLPRIDSTLNITALIRPFPTGLGTINTNHHQGLAGPRIVPLIHGYHLVIHFVIHLAIHLDSGLLTAEMRTQRGVP